MVLAAVLAVTVTGSCATGTTPVAVRTSTPARTAAASPSASFDADAVWAEMVRTKADIDKRRYDDDDMEQVATWACNRYEDASATEEDAALANRYDGAATVIRARSDQGTRLPAPDLRDALTAAFQWQCPENLPALAASGVG